MEALQSNDKKGISSGEDSIARRKAKYGNN
jgi:hypothetical protein